MHEYMDTLVAHIFLQYANFSPSRSYGQKTTQKQCKNDPKTMQKICKKDAKTIQQRFKNERVVTVVLRIVLGLIIILDQRYG